MEPSADVYVDTDHRWRVLTESLALGRSPVTPFERPFTLIDSVEQFEARVRAYIPDEPVVLLLGGIDSAVLIPYLHPDSLCITISFEGVSGHLDEAAFGRSVTKDVCSHKVLRVSVQELLDVAEWLPTQLSCPPTIPGPGLYLGCEHAADLGFRTVVTGVLADGHYKTPLKNFLERAHDPAKAVKFALSHRQGGHRYLRYPTPISHHFEPFISEGTFDVPGFIQTLYHPDGLQTDAIAALVGIRHISPYAYSMARVYTEPTIPELLFQRKFNRPLPRKRYFHQPVRQLLRDYTPDPDILTDPPDKANIRYRLFLAEAWWHAHTCADTLTRQLPRPEGRSLR